MAEQTSTTKARPAIYTVATGNPAEVASVEILGTLDDKPLDALRPNDKVWVRAASRRFGFDPGLRRDGQPLENRQRRSRKEPPDLPPNPFVSGSMGSRCATGNPGGMEDAPKFLLCGANHFRHWNATPP